MFAALVNRPNSNINLSLHSLSIKASGLLTNQAWFSPYDYGHIMHHKVLIEGSKKLPNKFKLSFIESHLEEWENNKDDNEQKVFANDFNRFCHIFKEIKKIKHPPPAIIREIKSMEKHLDDLYMQLSIIKSDELSEQFGYIPLEPLLREGIFGFLDYNDQKDLSFDDFAEHSIKEIMKLQLKKKTDVPLIFVLSGSLTVKENSFPEYCSINDEQSRDKNKIWFDIGFDITGIKTMNDTDFIALNVNVSKEGMAFNEAMHRWIEATQKDSMNFDDVTFYKNEIASVVKEFNDTMVNDIILQPYKDHPYRFRMQIGAMPVIEIWKYYFNAGCINKQEFEELIAETKDDPAFGGRWPVMSLSIFDKGGRKYSQDELLNIMTEPNPTKRKVINLD